MYNAAPALIDHARQKRISLFHGTNSEFESFSLKFAARPGMAGNGHLGIWLATTPDLAYRFGDICMVVEMNNPCVYEMDISELKTLHNEARGEDEFLFYQGVRNKLMSQGFNAIAIIEGDGNCAMFVALDPGKLNIMSRTQVANQHESSRPTRALDSLIAPNQLPQFAPLRPKG